MQNCIIEFWFLFSRRTVSTLEISSRSFFSSLNIQKFVFFLLFLEHFVFKRKTLKVIKSVNDLIGSLSLSLSQCPLLIWKQTKNNITRAKQKKEKLEILYVFWILRIDFLAFDWIWWCALAVWNVIPVALDHLGTSSYSRSVNKFLVLQIYSLNNNFLVSLHFVP